MVSNLKILELSTIMEDLLSPLLEFFVEMKIYHIDIVLEVTGVIYIYLIKFCWTVNVKRILNAVHRLWKKWKIMFGLDSATRNFSLG